jgi:hypothetical protein
LKSLHTFPEKSGQVVLAVFEQQFIPALAIASDDTQHKNINKIEAK